MQCTGSPTSTGTIWLTDGMTGKPAAEITRAVLTNVDFWGSDLTAELPGFEASVAASLDAIFTKGAAKAIEEVVAKA